MENKPINIFTSCDDNLTKHLPTLIMSIKDNMALYKINFFFLYHDIPSESIEKIYKFCKSIDVHFEAIQINSEDYEKYRKVKLLTSTESLYPVEGFFCLLPNLHLPDYVDRALYLDTGDIILSGDISEFYFSDFNGNVLTVSKGFASNWSYTLDDLYDRNSYLQIAAEYFNAGSVLFNVDLMRRININFDYYSSIVKRIKKVHDGYNWNTFGGGKRYVVQDDQGLLGVSFVGYINFFDPENLGNTNTKFNFRPFVYECNQDHIENAKSLSLKDLKPKIIHLLGNKPGLDKNKRKLLLRLSQECLELWDKYEEKSLNLMEELK